MWGTLELDRLEEDVVVPLLEECCTLHLVVGVADADQVGERLLVQLLACQVLERTLLPLGHVVWLLGLVALARTDHLDLLHNFTHAHHELAAGVVDPLVHRVRDDVDLPERHRAGEHVHHLGRERTQLVLVLGLDFVEVLVEQVFVVDLGRAEEGVVPVVDEDGAERLLN